MDLSKLSDADLKAAYEGNWQGVSDEGLRFLSATREKVGTGEDVARAGASGIARAIPKTLDFASGVGGEGINLLAKGVNAGARAFGGKDILPAPKFGEIYKNSDYFNAGTSKLLGEEYDPQTGAGEATKFVGEVVGPWGALSGARAAGGFVRGVTGKSAPFIRDPKVLLDRYKEGVEGLKNISFSPEQLAEGLQKPVREAIEPDFFANKSTDLANDLDNLDQLARTGTDGRRLEGFRRSLSNTKDPLANRVREGVDDFLESAAVPTDFRDSYRLMSKVRNLDDAITKGGDNLPMARTALKNQLIGKNARGYTPTEMAALRSASKAGAGETALRLGSFITGLPTAIASGNPAAAAGIYGTSRGFKMAADRAGLKRIEDARNTILNGGEIPTMAERFGAFVRGKIK